MKFFITLLLLTATCQASWLSRAGRNVEKTVSKASGDTQKAVEKGVKDTENVVTKAAKDIDNEASRAAAKIAAATTNTPKQDPLVVAKQELEESVEAQRAFAEDALETRAYAANLELREQKLKDQTKELTDRTKELETDKSIMRTGIFGCVTMAAPTFGP